MFLSLCKLYLYIYIVQCFVTKELSHQVLWLTTNTCILYKSRFASKYGSKEINYQTPYIVLASLLI